VWRVTEPTRDTNGKDATDDPSVTTEQSAQTLTPTVAGQIYPIGSDESSRRRRNGPRARAQVAVRSGPLYVHVNA